MAGLPPNFFDLCRTCQLPTIAGERKTIFHEEVAVFLEHFPTLTGNNHQPDAEERLPRVVCKACYELMDVVVRFIKRAERTRKQLEKLGQPQEAPRKDPMQPQSVAEKENVPEPEQRSKQPMTKKIRPTDNVPGVGVLVCSECRILFQTVEDATVHQMGHATGTPNCSTCRARFNTPTIVATHCQQGRHVDAGLEAWSCSLCEFWAADWAEVRRHLTQTHLPCDGCRAFWRGCLGVARQGASFVRTKACNTCERVLEFRHPLTSHDSRPSTTANNKLDTLNFLDAVKQEVSEEEPQLLMRPVWVRLKRLSAKVIQEAIAIKKEKISEEEQMPSNVELLPSNKPPSVKKQDYEEKEYMPLIENQKPQKELESSLDQLPLLERMLQLKQEEMYLKAEPASPKKEQDSSDQEEGQEPHDEQNLHMLVKLQQNQARIKSPTVLKLKCKYCYRSFTEQLKYIQHLRLIHLSKKM